VVKSDRIHANLREGSRGHVAAVITAQKAFPFGQRASFYRLLIGQTDNIQTRASQGLWSKNQVVDALGYLRMDFAQQLPRGSTSQVDDSGAGASVKSQ
jgi:hypothetical protein